MVRRTHSTRKYRNITQDINYPIGGFSPAYQAVVLLIDLFDIETHTKVG